MAPRFTKGGKIEQLEGFRKLKFGKLIILMILKICMLIHGGTVKKTSKLGPKVMRLKKR